MKLAMKREMRGAMKRGMRQEIRGATKTRGRGRGVANESAKR
jgi:hypothetical protein